MRISDAMITKNYLSTINETKKKISKLNEQISTQTKIHNPSDSPQGIAKLLSLNKKINDAETYINNVQEAKTFIEEAINGMESIQSQITEAATILTQAKDATKSETLNTFADKIDSILDSVLSSANSEFGGKYVFGGTDFRNNPYGLDGSGNFVSQLINDASGSQKIKITSTTCQKINISGTEVFGTIVSQSGNIDSATAIGGAVADTTTIYDSFGNEYDLNLTYTKTAANSYNLTYTIVDDGGTTVYTSGSPTAVVFDAADGKLSTINGNDKDALRISVPANNIDITLNLSGTTETASASSLAFSANQQRDIFNTLISIRNDLRNGIVPSDSDVQAVKDFNLHVLDKLAEAGNLQNQMENTGELLSNQKDLLTSLASKENDVDIAEAILDLQNQDYMLQLSYKMSAMILPKSLVDYI